MRGGGTVIVRDIRPEDREQLVRGFDRLSPESRYRRFMTSAVSLDDATLEYLTNVDGRDHAAIVAMVPSLDLKTETGVGVARYVRLPDEPDVAEAAVTVTDDYQRRGVGTILARALAEKATYEGIRAFRAEVLADNTPMLEMLAEAGAIERSRLGDTVVFDVPIGAANGAEAGPVVRILRLAAESMAIVSRIYRRWRRREASPLADAKG